MMPFIARADELKLAYQPLIDLQQRKLVMKEGLKMPLSIYTDMLALSKYQFTKPQYRQETNGSLRLPPVGYVDNFLSRCTN